MEGKGDDVDVKQDQVQIRVERVRGFYLSTWQFERLNRSLAGQRLTLRLVSCRRGLCFAFPTRAEHFGWIDVEGQGPILSFIVRKDLKQAIHRRSGSRHLPISTAR